MLFKGLRIINSELLIYKTTYVRLRLVENDKYYVEVLEEIKTLYLLIILRGLFIIILFELYLKNPLAL